MTTATRRRLTTAALIALLVLTLSTVTAVVPAIAANTVPDWGTFSATGFGIAILIGWPLGTLIIPSPRRRVR